MKAIMLFFFSLYLLMGKMECRWQFQTSQIIPPSAATSSENGFARCQCGSNKILVNKTLDTSTAKHIFKKLRLKGNGSANITSYPNEVDSFLENCEACEISFIECRGNPLNKSDYFCIKNVASFDNAENGEVNHVNRRFRRISDDGGIHIIIPMRNKKPTRVRRHAPACPFPSAMETAELQCVLYPSSIKCIQKCGFGYTLKAGPQVAMKCDYKEDKWKPFGFKECEAYIDCSLTLTSGGFVKCTSASLKAGPSCTIECDHYEDKPAVRKKAYSCTKTGEWEPSLPFCVISGSGLELVPAP
ncbi:uncharacterized protein LOC118195951 [Stegodyphus dumicola]|uniref:uncharacterized protein LOC118195951 n=1 Tax=Stegodyphus dumicola TaxID=202533 RepID=UPI0015AC971A|nr:uncharacterized protein LOC118195951 [Stegodyphus dumicola]